MIVCWLITSEEIFLNPFRLILSKSHQSLKSQGSASQSLKSSLYEPKEGREGMPHPQYVAFAKSKVSRILGCNFKISLESRTKD